MAMILANILCHIASSPKACQVSGEEIGKDLNGSEVHGGADHLSLDLSHVPNFFRTLKKPHFCLPKTDAKKEEMRW